MKRSIGAARDQLTTAWDRLIASDPGFTRFSFAARATLTAAFALGVLYAIDKISAQPIAVMLLGVVVALLASAMVNDPEPRQQKITTLLLTLPAAVSVTLGSWLASSRIAGDAVFVVVIFGAVYARRFGPRGFAFGMLAFITYFFSLFLHAQFSQLPWFMLALVVGAACAYTMRFFLFPDRPERRLRGVLRAFYARVARLLGAVIEAIATDSQSKRRRSGIRRQVVQLNETALMAEGELERLARTSARSESEGVPLALELFDLELAADRVAIASGDKLSASERKHALHALRRLQRLASQRNRGAIAKNLPEVDALTEHRLGFALRDLAQTLSQAPDAIRARSLLPQTTHRQQKNQENAEAGKTSDKDGPEGLRPTTRQAIQVAAAGALAIAAGELVSPQRWYWAAITAFVIFAGTNSRGETLAKGWQRVAGTFAGVIAGIFIAVAAGGSAGLSLALIFVCVFMAFYFIQVSYGLMIFWITILLALLYGMLGLFSIHLLTLRLEETAVGAAIGILVAVFLLPTGTRATVREASRDYLDKLAGLAAACAERLAGRQSGRDLMAEARVLDRSFQHLRSTAKPLTRDLAGAFGRRSTRRWLRALLACRYYARRLAQLVHPARPLANDAALIEAFVKAATRVNDNIDALINGKPTAEANAGSHTPFDLLGTELRQADARVQAAARCLIRIDGLIINLSRDFGAGARSGKNQRPRS